MISLTLIIATTESSFHSGHRSAHNYKGRGYSALTWGLSKGPVSQGYWVTKGSIINSPQKGLEENWKRSHSLPVGLGCITWSQFGNPLSHTSEYMARTVMECLWFRSVDILLPLTLPSNSDIELYLPSSAFHRSFCSSEKGEMTLAYVFRGSSPWSQAALPSALWWGKHRSWTHGPANWLISWHQGRAVESICVWIIADHKH